MSIFKFKGMAARLGELTVKSDLADFGLPVGSLIDMNENDCAIIGENGEVTKSHFDVLGSQGFAVTHFSEAVKYWKSTNKTSDMDLCLRELKPMTRHLPDIILRLGDIVNLLCKHLKDPPSGNPVFASKPICHLLAVLSRDVREEFTEFVPLVISSLSHRLLKDSAAPTNETVAVFDAVFSCFSYLFRYLHRPILVQFKTFVPIFMKFLTIHGSSVRDHVQQFAAESLGYLLKRVDYSNSSHIKSVLNILFDYAFSAESSDKVVSALARGIAVSLMEAVKNVNGSLSRPQLASIIRYVIRRPRTAVKNTRQYSAYCDVARWFFRQLRFHTSSFQKPQQIETPSVDHLLVVDALVKEVVKSLESDVSDFLNIELFVGWVSRHPVIALGAQTRSVLTSVRNYISGCDGTTPDTTLTSLLTVAGILFPIDCALNESCMLGFETLFDEDRFSNSTISAVANVWMGGNERQLNQSSVLNRFVNHSNFVNAVGPIVIQWCSRALRADLDSCTESERDAILVSRASACSIMRRCLISGHNVSQFEKITEDVCVELSSRQRLDVAIRASLDSEGGKGPVALVRASSPFLTSSLLFIDSPSATTMDIESSVFPPSGCTATCEIPTLKLALLAEMKLLECVAGRSGISLDWNNLHQVAIRSFASDYKCTIQETTAAVRVLTKLKIQSVILPLFECREVFPEWTLSVKHNQLPVTDWWFFHCLVQSQRLTEIDFDAACRWLLIALHVVKGDPSLVGRSFSNLQREISDWLLEFCGVHHRKLRMCILSLLEFVLPEGRKQPWMVDLVTKLLSLDSTDNQVDTVRQKVDLVRNIGQVLQVQYKRHRGIDPISDEYFLYRLATLVLSSQLTEMLGPLSLTAAETLVSLANEIAISLLPEKKRKLDDLSSKPQSKRRKVDVWGASMKAPPTPSWLQLMIWQIMWSSLINAGNACVNSAKQSLKVAHGTTIRRVHKATHRTFAANITLGQKESEQLGVDTTITCGVRLSAGLAFKPECVKSDTCEPIRSYELFSSVIRGQLSHVTSHPLWHDHVKALLEEILALLKAYCEPSMNCSPVAMLHRRLGFLLDVLQHELDVETDLTPVLTEIFELCKHRLTLSSNQDMRLRAVRMLGNSDDSHAVIPYMSELEHFANPLEIHQALLSFPIASAESKIDKDHRAVVVPTLVRLLVAFLTTRPRGKVGKRLASQSVVRKHIISYMCQVTDEELPLVLASLMSTVLILKDDRDSVIGEMNKLELLEGFYRDADSLASGYIRNGTTCGWFGLRGDQRYWVCLDLSEDPLRCHRTFSRCHHLMITLADVVSTLRLRSTKVVLCAAQFLFAFLHCSLQSRSVQTLKVLGLWSDDLRRYSSKDGHASAINLLGTVVKNFHDAEQWSQLIEAHRDVLTSMFIRSTNPESNAIDSDIFRFVCNLAYKPQNFPIIAALGPNILETLAKVPRHDMVLKAIGNRNFKEIKFMRRLVDFFHSLLCGGKLVGRLSATVEASDAVSRRVRGMCRAFDVSNDDTSDSEEEASVPQDDQFGVVAEWAVGSPAARRMGQEILRPYVSTLMHSLEEMFQKRREGVSNLHKSVVKQLELELLIEITSFSLDEDARESRVCLLRLLSSGVPSTSSINKDSRVFCTTLRAIQNLISSAIREQNSDEILDMIVTSMFRCLESLTDAAARSSTANLMLAIEVARIGHCSPEPYLIASTVDLGVARRLDNSSGDDNEVANVVGIFVPSKLKEFFEKNQLSQYSRCDLQSIWRLSLAHIVAALNSLRVGGLIVEPNVQCHITIFDNILGRQYGEEGLDILAIGDGSESHLYPPLTTLRCFMSHCAFLLTVEKGSSFGLVELIFQVFNHFCARLAWSIENIRSQDVAVFLISTVVAPILRRLYGSNDEQVQRRGLRLQELIFSNFSTARDSLEQLDPSLVSSLHFDLLVCGSSLLELVGDIQHGSRCQGLKMLAANVNQLSKVTLMKCCYPLAMSALLQPGVLKANYLPVLGDAGIMVLTKTAEVSSWHQVVKFATRLSSLLTVHPARKNHLIKGICGILNGLKRHLAAHVCSMQNSSLLPPPVSVEDLPDTETTPDEYEGEIHDEMTIERTPLGEDTKELDEPENPIFCAQKSLRENVIPILNRLLMSKPKQSKNSLDDFNRDQKKFVGEVRPEIASVLLQVLRYLPIREFHTQLTRLVGRVASALDTRLNSARKIARTALVQITSCLGPAYFSWIVSQLSMRLRRGFQRGVLIYSVNAALVNMVDVAAGSTEMYVADDDTEKGDEEEEGIVPAVLRVPTSVAAEFTPKQWGNVRLAGLDTALENVFPMITDELDRFADPDRPDLNIVAEMKSKVVESRHTRGPSIIGIFSRVLSTEAVDKIVLFLYGLLSGASHQRNATQSSLAYSNVYLKRIQWLFSSFVKGLFSNERVTFVHKASVARRMTTLSLRLSDIQTRGFKSGTTQLVGQLKVSDELGKPETFEEDREFFQKVEELDSGSNAKIRKRNWRNSLDDDTPEKEEFNKLVASAGRRKEELLTVQPGASNGRNLNVVGLTKRKGFDPSVRSSVMGTAGINLFILLVPVVLKVSAAQMKKAKVQDDESDAEDDTVVVGVENESIVEFQTIGADTFKSTDDGLPSCEDAFVSVDRMCIPLIQALCSGDTSLFSCGAAALFKLRGLKIPKVFDHGQRIALTLLGVFELADKSNKHVQMMSVCIRLLAYLLSDSKSNKWFETAIVNRSAAIIGGSERGKKILSVTFRSALLGQVRSCMSDIHLRTHAFQLLSVLVRRPPESSEAMRDIQGTMDEVFELLVRQKAGGGGNFSRLGAKIYGRFFVNFPMTSSVRDSRLGSLVRELSHNSPEGRIAVGHTLTRIMEYTPKTAEFRQKMMELIFLGTAVRLANETNEEVLEIFRKLLELILSSGESDRFHILNICFRGFMGPGVNQRVSFLEAIRAYCANAVAADAPKLICTLFCSFLPSLPEFALETSSMATMELLPQVAVKAWSNLKTLNDACLSSPRIAAKLVVCFDKLMEMVPILTIERQLRKALKGVGSVEVSPETFSLLANRQSSKVVAGSLVALWRVLLGALAVPDVATKISAMGALLRYLRCSNEGNEKYSILMSLLVSPGPGIPKDFGNAVPAVVCILGNVLTLMTMHDLESSPEIVSLGLISLIGPVVDLSVKENATLVTTRSFGSIPILSWVSRRVAYALRSFLRSARHHIVRICILLKFIKLLIKTNLLDDADMRFLFEAVYRVAMRQSADGDQHYHFESGLSVWHQLANLSPLQAQAHISQIAARLFRVIQEKAPPDVVASVRKSVTGARRARVVRQYTDRLVNPRLVASNKLKRRAKGREAFGKFGKSLHHRF